MTACGGLLESTAVSFNLFAAVEVVQPYISMTITYGTPYNDPWVQQSRIFRMSGPMSPLKSKDREPVRVCGKTVECWW